MVYQLSSILPNYLQNKKTYIKLGKHSNNKNKDKIYKPNITGDE